jgi:HEAT repeat protein
MFDIHAMKNEARNYNAVPCRILSLAILVGLTMFAGGLVRQSAAQEPSPPVKVAPRVEIEPRVMVEPRVKVDLPALDEFELKLQQLSLDKWDFPKFEKLDRLATLDNLKLERLDNLKLETLDKLEKFPAFEKLEAARLDTVRSLSYLDNWAQQGRGVSIGIGSGAGSGRGSDQADDDPCEFKISVLQALIQNDQQRGMAVATDWLKQGSTQTTRCRQAALSLLAHYGKGAATPTILNVARTDPDMKVRTKAISVLGSTNDPAVIDTLRDFALTSTDNDIVEASLYALSQHNSDRAITVLAEIAMSNRPVPLRKMAISNIANRPGEPPVDALLKIYEADQNVEIRKYVIAGFANRKSERAGAKMLEIAKTSDVVELRKTAVRGIAQRSREGAIDILIGLYDSEKNEEVKDQIVNTFGNYNDQKVTRKLIEIAKNPQTPIERRKRAIGWLSRSKDPEVLKFLEDLLK